MTEVTWRFEGEFAQETAQRLYTWLVDGGLEDQVIDTLSSDSVVVEMRAWDNDSLSVLFSATPRDVGP